jgi:uncharacterized iron-regulated protein
MIVRGENISAVVSPGVGVHAAIGLSLWRAMVPDQITRTGMKIQAGKKPGPAMHWRAAAAGLMVMLLAVVMGVGGCAMPLKLPSEKAPVKAFAPGTILSAATGAAVSFDELMADVRTARVVYVGEMHTSARHHEVQLRVIRALHDAGIRLSVGMEMFDRSYQAVLDCWTAGGLDEETFLRQTHWYANWRFDYGLYRSILDYIRTEKIPLVALNVPFSIPPKIRIGGTEYLTEYEKGYLPGEVDTHISAHRRYVEDVFRQHPFKNVRFEDFYLAQCVWEDAMAEAAAIHLGDGMLVVLAGNGHIQYKYGIPERVFKRNGLPYRTIYPVAADEVVDVSVADYLWVVD